MTKAIDRRAAGPSGRQIGRTGTLTRLGVGGALIGLAFAGVLHEGVTWYEGLAGIVGMPVAVLLVHASTVRVLGRRFAATGGLGFCVNFALGAVLFSVDATRDIAALFYGSAMLLAAARGYAGCEILAVSNLVLRRQDQVGCVLFSPLDEVEAHLSNASPRRGTV